MKTLWIVALTAITYASCTNSTATSTEATQKAKEERNKRIALESVRAFEKGKIDSVFKDVAPDAMDYGEGSNPPVKGMDSAKVGLKAWMVAIPNYKGSDFVAVADGDYVMVYGHWSGTWQNNFYGMKPTGRSFSINDVDIFKFNEEGKIIEHRSVQSNREAARQLGMDIPSL
jgi:predicted ester cyclase